MSHPSAGDSFTFHDPSNKLEDPKRLSSLRNTGLLNAMHRPTLDAVTRLAVQTTSASAAAVSLITSDRQVHPSFFGADGHVEPHEIPISHSFCQFIVVNDTFLVVENAKTHPVLHNHPAVLQDGVMAYAGYPLHDPSGEVLGALCVIDVVPRRWTEEHLSLLRDLALTAETEIALRLSQRATHLDHERLLRVLDGAENTMILIADNDGVVVTMNRAAARCLEPAATEVIGAWTLTDLAKITQPCGPEVGHGEAQDWTLELAGGQRQVISVQFSIVHDVNGEIEGYVVIGDDVSLRRQAEQALHDTVRKQADVVERHRAPDTARNDFIATANHELRTPVTNILGFTELLTDGAVGELTAAQSNVISRVDRNSRRLLYLVENLLSLERLDSVDVDVVRTTFDATLIAKCAWESLQAHTVGREIATVIEIEPASLLILGDPVQLERALLNLLTNAIKFTLDGGSVHLAVSSHHQDVIFEVSDTGLGIPVDEQSAVFDPFYRTKAAQVHAIPGSGIGLTVVRRITEDHGGQICLVSESDRGTTVSMTIPGLHAPRALEGPTLRAPFMQTARRGMARRESAVG